MLDAYRYPNGVCMAHDGLSLLFAESWACRVHRYWFDGPKAGTVECVISDMPGYPDNINRASDGNYWMAWLGMRTPTFDLALRKPGMRKRMTRRLPQDEWLFPNINTGGVVKFDDAGRILDTLGDLGGTSHPMVTSMREHKGFLYVGGILNNRVGRYRLPAADPELDRPALLLGPAGMRFDCAPRPSARRGGDDPADGRRAPPQHRARRGAGRARDRGAGQSRPRPRAHPLHQRQRGPGAARSQRRTARAGRELRSPGRLARARSRRHARRRPRRRPRGPRRRPDARAARGQSAARRHSLSPTRKPCSSATARPSTGRRTGWST